MISLGKVRHGSKEWHERRRAGIGSSDAAAVVDESPWLFSFELLLVKLGLIAGRVRERWEWDAMERGRMREPRARELYEKETGLAMHKEYVVHPNYPFLRAEIDGLNQVFRRGIEIKAPGLADHLLAVKGEVPKKYLWQCTHQMLVCDLPEWEYYSYREDKNGESREGKRIVIQRDSAREKLYLRRAILFWERVEERSPVLLQMKGNTMEFSDSEKLALMVLADSAKARGLRTLSIPSMGVNWDLGAKIPLAQGDRPRLASAPAALPKEADPGLHYIDFGKFKGSQVNEVDAKELVSYCKGFIEDHGREDLSPQLRALIDAAESHFDRVGWP